ncbi:MAG: hypothetical protein DWQ01_00315 [Planctomycetota bacterium]|nr:MAG: hypothetical protein DWQ01_00315 [Planctomycetota bacterium]
MKVLPMLKFQGVVSVLVCLGLLACQSESPGSPKSRTGPPAQRSDTGPTLNPVISPTAAGSVQLSGWALQKTSSIRIEGGLNLVETTVSSDSAFAVTVPLRPNGKNFLFVTEVFADGELSPPATTCVIQDSTPPEVLVDFPVDGATLHETSINVTGRISDLLSGYMGLDVLVNGEPAAVYPGIGTNGSFDFPNFSLVADSRNEIQILGRDAVGHETLLNLSVDHVTPTGPTLHLVSGGDQEGTVNSDLQDPIVLELRKENGIPFSGKVVDLSVARSNGRIRLAGSGDPGQIHLQALTDSLGRVRVEWTLGSDAGRGNNRLRISSLDVANDLWICANGLPGEAKQINLSSGNLQRVEVGAPAFHPLRVWISDGCNGVEGIPVRFSVLEGDGHFSGKQEKTVLSSATGHAETVFELGGEAGLHTVRASIDDLEGAPVVFSLTGIHRDPVSGTRFSGIVLNNAGQPLEGAICTLEIGAGFYEVDSDFDGRFEFLNIQEAGPGSLSVDGSAIYAVDGQGVPAGSFPSLHYAVVIAPDAANALGTPVQLPRLNPANVVSFDNTQDVELQVEGIAGLRMKVKAGSVTLADGTVPQPGNPVALSLNPVHADSVPMPMPDGASPPFAWTLQPGGTRFDPPVEITYPNMSGLPAGTTTYFLSFNHATENFEIVATGRVSDDGSCIESDPGSGISVAGWGCNCPPYAVNGDCKNCDPIPNGCGPSGKIFDLIPTEWFVPDCLPLKGLVIPFSVCCFSSPCNNHDVCWGTCGSDKESCDSNFFTEMLGQCALCSLGDPGILAKCSAAAFVYWAAVSYASGDHFCKTQREACECKGEGLPPGCSGGSTTHPTIGGVTSPFEDKDFDLMDDVWELAHGLDPSNRLDTIEDPDGDGVGNVLEFVHDLDPNNPDTDGNGIGDKEEIDEVQPPPPLALDDSWVVSVNGQTVPVDPDGTFNVANVAALDEFGSSGPGSPPDFLSDEFFRLSGTSTRGGVTRYVFSDPFQIQQGETIKIPGITVTETAPLSIATLEAEVLDPVLSVAGQQTQMSVVATLSDGSQRDVSFRSEWTLYRTSNPQVVSVDENGIVAAVGDGLAFITATNDGATAVAQVAVSLSSAVTDVVGFVMDESGNPVANASVSIIGLPGESTSQSDGSYLLSGMPTAGIPTYTIRARKVDGGTFFSGTEPGVKPVPGGLTDAGIIVVSEFGGGFGPIILSGMDPEDHGSWVGGAGWQMIQDIVYFVTSESVLSANPNRVVQLGGTSSNVNILISAVNPLGFVVDHFRGSDIAGVNFFDYDCIYMPTSDHDISGGISDEDLDHINQRGPDIIDFVNTGGGLAAFSNNHEGGYDWFPLGGIQTTEVGGSCLVVTPEGELILSPSATAVVPFHTAFIGPPGFFGLDVLAEECAGDQRALIIGGFADISSDPDGQN